MFWFKLPSAPLASTEAERKAIAAQAGPGAYGGWDQGTSQGVTFEEAYASGAPARQEFLWRLAIVATAVALPAGVAFAVLLSRGIIS